MIQLLPAILPVGLIILIGLIVGRSLSLQHQTLSQLILYVLSPALVIDSLYRNDLPISSSLALLEGFVITSGTVYLLVKIFSKITKFSPASTTALVATSLFPNNGNMGLSVVTFALGTRRDGVVSETSKAVFAPHGSRRDHDEETVKILHNKNITHGIHENSETNHGLLPVTVGVFACRGERPTVFFGKPLVTLEVSGHITTVSREIRVTIVVACRLLTRSRQ